MTPATLRRCWIASFAFTALRTASATAEEPIESAETPVPQETQGTETSTPFKFNVTSVSTALYGGDNRDTRVGEIETLANDHYSLLSDRLDLQGSNGTFTFGLRLDGYWFTSRPNPTQIGLDMVDLRRATGSTTEGEPTDPVFFRQKAYESGGELSNRYINWLIPAKYSIAYRKGPIQTTLGDFYAQFGRGFVLSVRKDDALSSDTTIRGARATFSTTAQQTEVKATLLAGSANPLRLDEASGRYLGVQNDVKRGFQIVTEAGMPHSIETDFAPKTSDCETTATCSFAPENIYGAQFQVAPPGFRLGTQGSILSRHTLLSTDIVRLAREIVTGSGSVEVPSLSGMGSLYFEGSGQSRNYEDESRGGYALYGHLDLYQGPLQLALEGKHYRAFYPLSAGISTARAREFSQVQYSRVPTAEAVWNTSQFEGFNTCTTGGRAKLDLGLNETASIFAWVGRYNTWAESVSNEECLISPESKNRVWDLATGTELTTRDRRTHGELSFGVRDDTTEREMQTAWGSTRVFYRESYARYDAVFHLTGRYSLQFQGWHRYKNQTVGGQLNPWFVGHTVNALEIAPLGNVALGIEYDTQARTPDLYLNAQITYRLNSASNLTLFLGQRRGTERCVGGVCRVYPPFEGARLDVTVRL